METATNSIMEFVDFASRGPECVVYVAGLPKARAAEIIEQIQTRTTGPTLTTSTYQKHSRTSSCVLVLTSRFAAVRAIEAWDGAVCFGRQITVQAAQRPSNRLQQLPSPNLPTSSWRDIHKVQLLTAHQCVLVANACLGVSAWSSKVAAVTAVHKNQISNAAPHMALSQQEADLEAHIDSMYPNYRTGHTFLSKEQTRSRLDSAASSVLPPSLPTSQSGMPATDPAAADDGDSGPDDLNDLQSASGSFFATPLNRASTGCIEQDLPSLPHRAPASSTAPAFASAPSGAHAQSIFVGPAADGGQQDRAAAAAHGLDFSNCTWSADAPADVSSSSAASTHPASGSDDDDDVLLGGVDIAGPLQVVDDSSFVPDLHSGLLLPGADAPHKPEHYQEHDIGWVQGDDACIADGSAVFDNGCLEAAVEGAAPPPNTLNDSSTHPSSGDEGIAAYTAEVHVAFADSRVTVVGRGAFGQLSDEGGAARAGAAAARRAAPGGGSGVHTARHSREAQVEARDTVLVEFAERWGRESPKRKLARWRARAVENALQNAFRQVRLAVSNGGPVHGGTSHVLVQGPEVGTRGLTDAAGGVQGGMAMRGPAQVHDLLALCQQMQADT